MPSQVVIDVLGALGGATFALMLTPQLIKLYRTKKAGDISYGFLCLYALGTVFMLLYLYWSDAMVAFICMAVELGIVAISASAKVYLDHWGPYSPRALRLKSESEMRLGPDEPSEQGFGADNEAAGGMGGSQRGAGPGGSNHGPGGHANGSVRGRGSVEGRRSVDALERGVANGPATGGGGGAAVPPGVRQRGHLG